jgi:hypothetical protein
MEKKQYTVPTCIIIRVRTSLLCTSGSNTYKADGESGLIRTSTQKVDAAYAETKQAGNVQWDDW